MTRSKASRMRLGGLLALALGAIALLALPGLAAAKDRNHDRIPDRWEKRHKLSLKVDQARKDQDRDHLRNLAEFKAGHDPRDSDSDDDGIDDGDENAGTIASFDAETGKLTINLFGGDTVTGFVTAETEIQCGGGCDDNSEHGDDSGATVSRHDGEDDGEDSSGPSESSGSSDDVGEEEHSDDVGEDDSSDDHGTHSGSDDHASSCTVADLVPGAVVEEAELKLQDGVATFEEIELDEDEGGATTT